jgi:hypothetical protein
MALDMPLERQPPMGKEAFPAVFRMSETKYPVGKSFGTSRSLPVFLRIRALNIARAKSCSGLKPLSSGRTVLMRKGQDNRNILQVRLQACIAIRPVPLKRRRCFMAALSLERSVNAAKPALSRDASSRFVTENLFAGSGLYSLNFAVQRQHNEPPLCAYLSQEHYVNQAKNEL